MTATSRNLVMLTAAGLLLAGPARVHAEAPVAPGDAPAEPADAPPSDAAPPPDLSQLPRARMIEPPVYAIDADPERMARKVIPFKMSLRLGAGVSGFLEDDSRALTSSAGTWEARLTMGTRATVATELAYLGSARDVDAEGLMGDSTLIGSGAEAALRFNAPAVAGVIRPFAVAGIGFMNYSLVNSSLNQSIVPDSETALHFPVALGLEYRSGRMLFDVRGTVRPAFEDQLTRVGSEDDEAGVDSWAATVGAAVEF